MPVPAQIGCLTGYDHQVSRSRRDHLVAARAQVSLAGLVGLDPPHVDGVEVLGHRVSIAASVDGDGGDERAEWR